MPHRFIVTARFVGQQRGRGERVRFVQLDQIGHLVAGHASVYTTLPWIDARFAGLPAPNADSVDRSFSRKHGNAREIQWF